jgi:hypothetical protein
LLGGQADRVGKRRRVVLGNRSRASMSLRSVPRYGGEGPMTSAKKVASIAAPFHGAGQVDPQVEVVELGLAGLR